MKAVTVGLAFLIAMGGVAYCQSSVPKANEHATHPGTALLDSMGIVAGAPDATGTRDAQATLPSTTVVASPNGTPGKQP